MFFVLFFKLGFSWPTLLCSFCRLTFKVRLVLEVRNSTRRFTLHAVAKFLVPDWGDRVVIPARQVAWRVGTATYDKVD
jgi:hypothetical protein